MAAAEEKASLQEFGRPGGETPALEVTFSKNSTNPLRAIRAGRRDQVASPLVAASSPNLAKNHQGEQTDVPAESPKAIFDGSPQSKRPGRHQASKGHAAR